MLAFLYQSYVNQGICDLFVSVLVSLVDEYSSRLNPWWEDELRSVQTTNNDTTVHLYLLLPISNISPTDIEKGNIINLRSIIGIYILFQPSAYTGKYLPSKGLIVFDSDWRLKY